MTMLTLRENALTQVTRRFSRQLGHRWLAGDRLPTVRELADELGASHGTVYRVLQLMTSNGLLVSRPRQGMFVSPQFSHAKLQAMFARESQEAASGSARTLSGKRVALYISAMCTHMLPARDVIESALAARGCSVACLSYDQPGDPAQAHGLIFINPGPLKVPIDPSQQVLIVSGAAYCPEIPTEHFDLVGLDQEQGAALVGRYMRQRGHEEVCFAGVSRDGQGYEVSCRRRLDGFMAGWGKPLEKRHQLVSPFYSPLGGANMASQYAKLEPRPRGVFAATDDLASGFISGAEALGLRLWRDYELVGFDGMPGLQELSARGIPSVQVPAELMGRHAVDLFISRMAEPSLPSRKLWLACSLPAFSE